MIGMLKYQLRFDILETVTILKELVAVVQIFVASIFINK